MREGVGVAGDITPENLVAAGYKEWKDVSSARIKADRHFQKRFRDEGGTRYFINFRQWHWEGRVSWDSELCNDTANDGYVWITFRQPTIAAHEAMANAMWIAAGAVYYERDGDE